MTDIKPVFVWRKTRGINGYSCALYPFGKGKSMDNYETIVAEHELSEEESNLSLGALAEKYPAPEYKAD